MSPPPALLQQEGSVLWLSESHPLAMASLREYAAAAGVAPERLVFARRVPSMSDHLARHRLADLFLDTLPYNAHTTASDALWAGLPVLTQIGESFPGRVAASLLTAIGLPELIVQTTQQFESLAIELANTPGKLASIRERLARNRSTAPLFDTKLFTHHFQRAYAAMVARAAGFRPNRSTSRRSVSSARRIRARRTTPIGAGRRSKPFSGQMVRDIPVGPICRLRAAPASGISAIVETWPSG
jgi:Glycosyl transferase family 41